MAVDFAGTFALLAAAEASSSDEDESEEDSFCVFLAAVEFVVDLGATEDVCSLDVLVLVQVFKLVHGFGGFFTGTFSSSDEDESEEEVFLTACRLDAATCVCLDLDLSGEGF